MAGLVRRFDPLPRQREFMEATEPEILYSGAFGAGKSRVGCEKGHFLSHYYPGNRGLIVRKVAADLPSTTLVTLFEKVLAPSDVLEHHHQKRRITVRSSDPSRPSVIWYRGIDRPAGIGSMELGWVFFDECIEGDEEDWLMLDGRLRHSVPFTQIFGATNPGAPSHWLYKRFYLDQPRDEQGRPVRRVFESNALENVYNTPAYRARLGRFKGVHRDRYVLGKWVGYEGLVYPAFNPLVHIVRPFPIPKSWRRVRSIDFGTANPFVCAWWAEDPRDGSWYCYREIYMTGRRATDHAQHINQLSRGERVDLTVADHDLGDRLDLEEAGIPTVAARKDVREGIQAVAARLGTPSDPSDAPGLYWFDDALVEEDPRLLQEGRPMRTTDEFGVYKWAKGAHETDRDEPLKKHDHGMDQVRYFVMEVDRGGDWSSTDVLDDVLGNKPKARRL
jgi:PBSX family phage terminase large subunit